MPRRPCALDTSVAIPLLMRSHPAHAATTEAVSDRRLFLTPHSQVEAYSVLTRLPHDARVAPDDALRVLLKNFSSLIAAQSGDARDVLPRLAEAGVVGGAVYDGLVALAAVDAGLPLVTRDIRALPTYAVLGATVELLT